MIFWDKVGICLNNLWRRKLRTALTVLGVVIGVVSIVVMMSVGIAQQYYMEEYLNKSANLTEITVNSDFYGGGPFTSSHSSDEKRLDDEAREEILQMEYVKDVVPVLNFSAEASRGPYSNYLNIYAYPREYLETMNLEFSEGALPAVEDYEAGTIPLLIGPDINYQFYDSKNPNAVNGWELKMEDKPPHVNMYEEAVFVTFPDPLSNSDEGEMQEKPAPKKYLLQADGIFGSANYRLNWKAISDLEVCKTFLNKVYKGKAWPGQPATKTGRSTGTLVYNEFIVISSDVEQTTTITKALNELGYQAYSDYEMISSSREQSARVQMILGGIGGISFIVAAIGISNTMMMSIYERTKEIGVFKVLGCPIRTIRSLYLMESGMIGLIGGSIGISFSFAVSHLMNYLNSNSGGGGMGGAMSDSGETLISMIPPWLALAALGFSVIIGMIAGLIPANRAMRLSPLEAIRTQ